MSTQSVSTELIKFALQALVVGIGWWVVNRMAVSRERDKSRREMITKNVDALCDLADDIFEIARDYHFADKRDHKSEIQLKISLKDFSYRVGRLELLTGDRIGVEQHREAVIRFRRSITEHHFEDQHEGAIDVTSALSQDMAAGVVSIKERLGGVLDFV